MIRVLHGDCCEIMPTLEAESFDAIVTDPPGGISFMGKAWDGDRGGRDHWIAWMQGVASECLRLAKPGAHALVWALPRTTHWTATAWENAGWDVRDRVSHITGQGFPKSLNVAKAIDKAAGAKGTFGEARTPAHERYITKGEFRGGQGDPGWQRPWMDDPEAVANAGRKYIPATPEATQWTGWGTALKPACEDWWLLRKPLSERTVAVNVLAHGTGALNIDACRVPSGPDHAAKCASVVGLASNRNGACYDEWSGERTDSYSPAGRWPANLVHDGSPEVLEAFAAFGDRTVGKERGERGTGGIWSGSSGAPCGPQYGDSGSPARFFFSAKANADDRLGSKHPTIKSTDLLAWLLRLVTPPGGRVLDPFAGSGSTGMAAMREGFDATLIELEEESVKDIHNRLAHVHGHDTPLFAAKEDAEHPTIDLFNGAA